MVSFKKNKQKTEETMVGAESFADQTSLPVLFDLI